MMRRALLLLPLLGVLGCAHSSGLPAARIGETPIATAYLPLRASVMLGLESANGAAVLVAPGIAATNGHNRNLVDPKAVIGEVRDYDLLFFHADQTVPPPQMAEPKIGDAVTAYGQGADSELRIAHGVVRSIVTCDGCGAPAYFTFEGNAGPGFSGGPVITGDGRMVGIVFGYKDEGKKRLIYAYDPARIRMELARFQPAPR